MDNGTIPISVVYNVPHEMPLTILIAVYFYMTGLSAGSFIMSTLAYAFGVKQFKPLGKIGVVAATVLLMLAPANLILDLEQPLRFWHLFPYMNATSPITYGSFLLTAYPINCVIYGYFMFTNNAKWTRVFGLIGIPLAVSVHGYTGFILALGKARALWNTAVMPPLFLVSAMVSGIAMMILLSIIISGLFSSERKINRDLIVSLGRILAGSILVDLFLIFGDVLVLLTSDAEPRENALMLLTGSFAPYFVGLEIIVGGAIPLFLLLFPKTNKMVSAIAVASVLVMIGIFAMRYTMVVGGQTLPLA